MLLVEVSGASGWLRIVGGRIELGFGSWRFSIAFITAPAARGPQVRARRSAPMVADAELAMWGWDCRNDCLITLAVAQVRLLDRRCGAGALSENRRCGWLDRKSGTAEAEIGPQVRNPWVRRYIFHPSRFLSYSSPFACGFELEGAIWKGIS